MSKSYACDICESKFFTKSVLLVHKKRIHHNSDKKEQYHNKVSHDGGIKSEECNICGKRFTCGQSLRNHVRHSHERKPQECYKCNRRFSDMPRLEKHLRNHEKTIQKKTFKAKSM